MGTNRRRRGETGLYSSRKPRLVIGVFKRNAYAKYNFCTPIQLKASTESIFLKNALLNVFFPDSVAKIHCAKLTGNNIPYYIQERIYGRHPNHNISVDSKRSWKMYSAFSLIGVHYDGAETNSIVQGNGREKMIDFHLHDIELVDFSLAWEYIGNLSEADRQTALLLLEGLQCLKQAYDLEKPKSDVIRQKYGYEVDRI